MGNAEELARPSASGGPALGRLMERLVDASRGEEGGEDIVGL